MRKFDVTDHRISQSQKNSKGKQWYKNIIDYYDSLAFMATDDMWREIGSRRNRMMINYDLMGNKINEDDFMYVTNPWRQNVGQMPARLENRDIITRKINAILGIEYKRPFEYQVVAVNPDATTRREQMEFDMLKQAIMQTVMTGQSPDQDLPYEVKKYLGREYQDPVEALGNQLLQYLSKKLDIKEKFNHGLKHALISGFEIYWVGEENGEPTVKVVNPLYFDCDMNGDIMNIEDGQWAVCEYRMNPVDVIKVFGDELTDAEKQEVFELYDNFSATYNQRDINDDFDYIRVLHVTFKSLRKIGFLRYMDEEGQEQEIVVPENYRKQETDIDLKWAWIPEVHEGWRIGRSIYKRMRPIPGQHKSMDNLYNVKLPYYGRIYDKDNTEPISAVDRIRSIQYLYNILMYRIEILMAQNKGRKVAINIGAIPTKSANITLPEFERYLEANPYFYLNPNEEGNRYSDITQLVKEVDLSTGSDINMYIQLADYLDRMAGYILGVTPQLEGQIQEREAVSNVQRVLSLSTNILEPTFQHHDAIKRNVLTALIEQARVTYAKNQPRSLNYVLDDGTLTFLTIDQEKLDNASYGVFISDNSKISENQKIIEQLAQAAMQNGMVNLSTVLKVLSAGYLQDAQEILTAGEAEMQAQREKEMQMQQQLEAQKFDQERQLMEMRHAQAVELLQLEERLKYDREIAKQSILAMGFNKDQDVNQNEVPDVIEHAKLLLDKRKLEIEERKVDILAEKAKSDAKIANNSKNKK
jgi:hypothetical protein